MQQEVLIINPDTGVSHHRVFDKEVHLLIERGDDNIPVIKEILFAGDKYSPDEVNNIPANKWRTLARYGIEKADVIHALLEFANGPVIPTLD